MTDTILTLTTTQARVRWLLPCTVRVTHVPRYGEFPPNPPWLEDVLPPTRAPEEEEIELWPLVKGGRLHFNNSRDDNIFAEAAPPELGLERTQPYVDVDVPQVRARAGLHRITDGVRLSIAIHPGETFYGWGEQFSAFARREGALTLRIRDAIAPLQARGATYSAIPLFFSSRGYAFWLLNSYTSRWRIDPSAGRMEIEAEGPPCDYVLIWGPDWQGIISSYTQLTGRPAMPPRWVFGLWATSYPQEPQAAVIQHVEAHRQKAIPLDAVILDYHWEQGFHTFKWRTSLFPEPNAFIEKLNRLGVRLGLIITPYINQRTRPLQKALLNRLARNLPVGVETGDERALPEFAPAAKQGLFAHQRARWWFGQGGMLDFSNPATAAWWNAKLRPLYQQGVTFFKNDAGESLPDDAHSHLGIDGAEYHNLYGFYYSRAMYEDMEAQGRRGWVYARTAWAGSQRYPGLFLGDQKPTFAHMRAALRAGLNLSLQGFAFWGADIFGLDGRTTPETHMRYAQWALLTPTARYFWRPDEIDPTRLPWAHGPEVEANFRRYTELRYRLLPTFYSLAWQAAQTGLPIVRPMRLAFPEDPRCAAIDDQYLLGENLMVCPVLHAGETNRRIVLPAGTWHDFWSGATWQGPDEIDYPAPLERLPLLVHGGALLAMGPVMQSISDAHPFNRLELHLWPAGPKAPAASSFAAVFTLYEDDGASLDYRHGAYALTTLRSEFDGHRLRLRLPPVQGAYPGLPAQRQVRLVAHRSPRIGIVLLGRTPVGSWYYDAARQETQVDISVNTAEENILTLETIGPPQAHLPGRDR